MEDVVISGDFWRGRRVFVTGHTGFKGSWLCLWLQRMGAELVGYSLPAPTSPSLFQLSKLEREMISLTGDVRDGDALSAAIAEHRPELVLHMAAQSLVRVGYREPVETFATNVMGTVNVLEGVRRADGVRGVLVVTSDKCYENREWVWGYREDEAMGGYDPYSSSKGCAELVTAAYRRSYPESASGGRLAIGSARAGNVIGGGDWASDRLVPDVIEAFAARRPVVLRNPAAIRPWQHVLEPLAGYLMLAERLWKGEQEFAEAWNFGADDGDSRTVEWVVQRMAALWGGETTWRVERDGQPHEAHSLKLDCSKARARLGWAPRLSLEQALEWIVAWYRSYHAGEDVRAVTERQIRDFELLLAPAARPVVVAQEGSA